MISSSSDHDPWTALKKPLTARTESQKFPSRDIEQSSRIAIRDPSPTPEPQPERGPVKGNINSQGRKLYHVPGCPQYEATQIDESAGERYFATEAEAIAAGWVKAGNCP